MNFPTPNSTRHGNAVAIEITESARRSIGSAARPDTADGITTGQLKKKPDVETWSIKDGVANPGSSRRRPLSGRSSNHSSARSSADIIMGAPDEGRRRQRSMSTGGDDHPAPSRLARLRNRVVYIARKYATFIGPGFIIAVAYIDPGNYSTDVTAGAQFEYKLLFILFLSNLLAMFLQTLSCKLGTVTGSNLPELCRDRFPTWLNVLLCVMFEAAIIATDLAEVIGTAIALNILFKIPLVAGVAITMIDVIIVLFAWRPEGTMRATRYFEMGVAILVIMVICCFVALLTRIKTIVPTDVLKGYLPNKTAFSSEGIYSSLSIMGAVVMPHSLILGTGLTQPRLLEWDIKHGFADKTQTISGSHNNGTKYRPTIGAVRSILTYSIVELCLSLVTFALFVNSAILIVAGATLFNVDGAADADLFGIHKLLSDRLSPVAGTLFALALLASGQSAGVVCTMAGQLVSEGFFRWTIRPWLRRLVTRSIAVLPCIVVAGVVGRDGLAAVLNGSQVVLAILLPIIAFPLIYFTGRRDIMRIQLDRPDRADEDDIELTETADALPATPSTEPNGASDATDSVSPQSPTATRTISHQSGSRGGSLPAAAAAVMGRRQQQQQQRGSMTGTSVSEPNSQSAERYLYMQNAIPVQVIGWLVWLFITGLNVYLIAILTSGKAQI